jgi:hypothetical protein
VWLLDNYREKQFEFLKKNVLEIIEKQKEYEELLKLAEQSGDEIKVAYLDGLTTGIRFYLNAASFLIED